MADTTTPDTSNLLPGPYVAFQTDLKERIATNNPKVRELLLDDMTSEEILRRKTAVKSLVSKLDEKVKELRKLEKGGAQSFNLQGLQVGETVFTKAEADSLKKLREEIQKFENALSKGFDEGDFSKVLELGK